MIKWPPGVMAILRKGYHSWRGSFIESMKYLLLCISNSVKSLPSFFHLMTGSGSPLGGVQGNSALPPASASYVGHDSEGEEAAKGGLTSDGNEWSKSRKEKRSNLSKLKTSSVDRCFTAFLSRHALTISSSRGWKWG